MAYGNYLASVDWGEVTELRGGHRASLIPMEITCVSHLLAGGVREQPLVRCLFEMLDRGESLSPIFWHPLRVPVVHSPQAVSILRKPYSMP